MQAIHPSTSIHHTWVHPIYTCIIYKYTVYIYIYIYVYTYVHIPTDTQTPVGDGEPVSQLFIFLPSAGRQQSRRNRREEKRREEKRRKSLFSCFFSFLLSPPLASLSTFISAFNLGFVSPLALYRFLLIFFLRQSKKIRERVGNHGIWWRRV